MWSSLHAAYTVKFPSHYLLLHHDCWQLDSSHIPGMTRTHHPVREKTHFFNITALTYPISQERYAGYFSSLIHFVIFCVFQIYLLNYINFIVHFTIYLFICLFYRFVYIYMYVFMKSFVFLPFY